MPGRPILLLVILLTALFLPGCQNNPLVSSISSPPAVRLVDRAKARACATGGPSLARARLIRLVGTRSNRAALGAIVTALLPDGRRLRRTCQTGGSYLSTSNSTVHFGLGDDTTVASLIVQWPTGKYQEFPASPADRCLTLQASGK